MLESLVNILFAILLLSSNSQNKINNNKIETIKAKEFVVGCIIGGYQEYDTSKFNKETKEIYKKYKYDNCVSYLMLHGELVGINMNLVDTKELDKLIKK